MVSVSFHKISFFNLFSTRFGLKMNFSHLLRWSPIFGVQKYLSTDTIKISLVGSGPACFHLLNGLLQRFDKVQIDIYEKSIVPFGFIRTGIAPDHQAAKNMVSNFTRIFQRNSNRVSFNGNVNIGPDLSLTELRNAYDLTILCYGAQSDRKLNIPGENLANVISARQFVGWYNGVEEYSNLNFNLNTEEIAVIGNGNVALDVSRILLKPLHCIKNTDISDFALSKLKESRVKCVHVIGRQGPTKVTCTTKELREMLEIPNCEVLIRKEDLMRDPDVQTLNDRAKIRRFQLMMDASLRNFSSASKKCIFHFWKRPVEITPFDDKSKHVGGINFKVNTPENDKSDKLDVGLVIRSIGYTSLPLDDTVPFDFNKGIISHFKGRVIGSSDLYCCGWVKTGPVGPFQTWIKSYETADTIKNDVQNGVVSFKKTKRGKEEISQLLRDRGVRVVNFDSWLKIDELEKELGREKGKLREKIISKEKMFNILSQMN